jgi:serine protease Do/serine protease DegQ
MRLTYGLIAYVLIAFGIICPTSVSAQSCGDACFDGRSSFADIIERALPAVVSIAVKGREASARSALFAHPVFGRIARERFASPKLSEFTSSGSGTIVSAEQGLILANVHVIERADAINVTLADGRELTGEVVGVDAATDVAVLRVPPGQLTALPVGNSDAVRAGDIILALGSPFGLQGTATMGMVSAVMRSGLGFENYESFIQIDAPVNIGNSGGALVNQRGELIGITTAIMSPDTGNVGVGFAVPINMALDIMQQLVASGTVRRGQLGVRGQDITSALARDRGLDVTQGVLVTEVREGTSAARAGLRAGDVVTAIDGRTVRKATELATAVAMKPLGSTATIEIERPGGHASLPVEIQQLDPRPQMTTVPAEIRSLAGVELASIEPGHPLFGELMGAEVVRVRWLSRAAQAGLAVGDIVVKLNGAKVRSPSGLVNLAKGKDGFLRLDVVRNGVPISMVVR